MVVFLDFAKAFDTLDRDFLVKALRSCNLGDTIIRRINLLYHGAENCVLNNGYSSGWFPLEAGLRQGRLLSPFLFILALEKMAEAIRIDRGIRGITVNEYKISQYADDSTVFLKHGLALENLLILVRDFAAVSGLHLNIHKSVMLQVNCTPVCGPLGSQIRPKDTITVLGIEFSVVPLPDPRCLKGFSGYIDKMSNVCDRWSKRHRSIKGKVTVIHPLVYPIVYYAAHNLYCPEYVVSRIAKIINNSLWNGHSAEISVKTLTLSVADGGLGFYDFEHRLNTAKIMWVKQMAASQQDLWTDFLVQFCGLASVIDIPLCKSRSVFPGLPPFYRYMLIA